MVFSVWVKFDGSGRRKGTGREGMGVVAGYSWNQGNSLFFRVMDSIYRFYIGLFAPNYVVMAPLPGATVEDYFKLEGAGLLNIGYGYIVTSKYEVRLSQQNIYYIIYYYIEILGKNVLLTHYNRLSQLFAPSPVSLVF